MGIFSFLNKNSSAQRTLTKFSTPELRQMCDDNASNTDSQPLTLQRFTELFGQTYSYRSLSAVYACVELISNAISSMPLRVVKEDIHGHREVVKHHPLQRIFKDKVISTMSMQTMIKKVVQDILLSGNGYLMIKRGDTGAITGLRYLKPSSVSVQYDDYKDILYYIVTVNEVKSLKVQPKDIIHLTKDTRDGVNGIPITNFAEDVLDLAKTSEKAAKNFFDNNMQICGVLSCSTPYNIQQRNEAEKAFKMSGDPNSIPVLPFGVDFKAMTVDAAKGQLLESRSYENIEIARFFGVPVQLIFSGDKLTYNNLEQLNIIFLQHTLTPYIINIESEFTRKLFLDDDELIVDMDEDAFILRTDKSSTASYLNTLVGGGIMTVNEARKELGLSEIEDGDGLHIAYSDASKAEIGGQSSESVSVQNEDE